MGSLKKVGRPREPGRVFRFDFYYRFIPGQDPPELETLLEAIVQAKGRKRRDILRAALLGGAQQARETATRVEDSADASLFEEMFEDF
ncbi:MAG: hypothetical protein D6784_10120 [Chloroflexi bacterium]|nr:MAG: hypothetical protein D6784_10120 [Chloroflexota bacterium]